jgi:hypothetical protein
LLTPSTQNPPPLVVEAANVDPRNAFTRFVNFLDLCAVSVPNGVTKAGFPTGLQIVCELGLEPLTTPVRSPQSNGMAESFVKTIKHDYITFMHKPDVPAALSHLACTFEHYNERHPHKALKYRSPREFRRTAASST